MKRIFELFWRNHGGAVAPIVAISLFALIAVAGIAFDYARVAGMDTELQSAADEAALAAASQLDGLDSTETGGLGACDRARQAALTLIANNTYFANDGATPAITITDTTAGCNVTEGITFWQNKAATIPATNDVEANFVEVTVNARRANFALTPIVNALNSGNVSATARAGLGTALCKVPPLMFCPPTTGIDWDAWKGRGIRLAAVTGKGGSWAPGEFGYLGPNDAPTTKEGLAYVNPTFSCQNVDNAQANTGNTTGAVDAINTRFDIYAYGTGDNPLGNCTGSVCQPAANVVKDLVRDPGQSVTGANGCKFHSSQGWHTPANRFRPVATTGTDPLRRFQEKDGSGNYKAIDAMGLPRDNCHYSTYAGKSGTDNGCSGTKFGDGAWARGDYFEKYHSGVDPNADDSTLTKSTMTRYETYRWEIDHNRIPDNVSAGGSDQQEGIPVCRPNPPDISPRDRRKLTVAAASNCASLKGSSVNVQIGEWVDVFFVEPGAPNNSRDNDLDTGMEIYLEVIGKTTSGNSGQMVRRDVPYLVR